MTDIKIIGAGPGGLLAGLYLIEEGFSPHIFEKQDRESYKSTPCAEGISEGAIDKLREDIDFDSGPAVNRKLDEASITFPQGYSVYWEEPAPVILDRTKWLKSLAGEFERRGGVIEYGSEIENFESLDYDCLIGADGPNSAVREFIGGEVEVVACCQYKFYSEDPGSVAEFYWDKTISDYYSWIFPKEESINIGCAGSVEDLDRFVQSQGLGGDELERQIHPISLNGSKFQEDNILLIGDAAGMINPVLGDGLGPIISASEILSECVSAGDIEVYEERVREELPDLEITKFFIEFSQSDLEKMGILLDDKNLLDFLYSFFGDGDFLDFFDKKVFFSLFKGFIFDFPNMLRFLLKILPFFEKSGDIKKSLLLWSKGNGT